MTGVVTHPDFQAAAARLRDGDPMFALQVYGRLLCQHVGEGLLLHLIGVCLHQLGHSAEALRWLARARAVVGPDAVLAHNTGESAWAVGDRTRATAAYRQALAGQPDLLDSRVSLAMVLREAGETASAHREARVALALAPGHPRALSALGLASEATADFGRAVIVDPSQSSAWINLGAMLLRDTALGAAARANRRALAIAPSTSEAWVNLGSVELGLCHPAKAVRLQRRGLALRSTPGLHSNLLFSMLSDPASDDAAQLAEALRWAQHHAAPVRTRAVLHPGRGDDPERPLIVGYFSADLRRHSVAGNIVELLERHDRSLFRMNGYAEVSRPDAMTDRFRAVAERWLFTPGMSDAEIAAAIHRDRVDILVHLGGHTASNRLVVAAFRPAPIQVSYGAPATTGLAEMDAWLSDADLTPPGWENRFVERVHRLPTFFAFEVPAAAGDPTFRPAAAAPRLGSFNNPSKLNDAVFATWSRVLEHLPSARLHLGYHGFFEDSALQQRVRQAMPAVADRIDFLPRAANAAAHFARLCDVDVILDPFPFGGHNTTFDALWMGVPVVTFADERFVGRVSAAIYRVLGLEDLVASNVEDYVERAVTLSGDRSRLHGLRLDLRDRLRRSVLMDYPRQVRALEAAYREMWRRYCGGASR